MLCSFFFFCCCSLIACASADPQCGPNAPQGSQTCPLNTCCSALGYCGTSSAYCINADPIGGTRPCQRGYGTCGTIQFPNCGAGSTTASHGRRVAYWQVASVNRACNALPVSLIPTQGLTHLIFAFMAVSSNNYRVVPFDQTAVPFMHPFTALASTSLATYMAVGGSSMSAQVWSAMASNQTNRAVFINSVEQWLSVFRFQGVDLDWEFPDSAADRENFVALVREMKESFIAKYPYQNWGISVVLDDNSPPDFSSLSFYDPVALEPYIDFFNFMAYDLHGPWEAATQGAIVRPQTAISDVNNAITPLWFAGVDPSKLNLGLAAYGRGYTLSNPTCNTTGCPYSGASIKGPCSNEQGILSMREVQVLIQQKGLRPTMIQGQMVKQVVYGEKGDQWMGFDDDETWGLKRSWADQLCIGGTAVWSLDLQTVGT
ncbi:hypothetical protein ACMFMG_009720 [Clarireedia jacksonii]